MSASSSWHGEQGGGFAADNLRFFVGHETLRGEGAGRGHDGFVQGRDKHQHHHHHHHAHAHAHTLSPLHPHHDHYQSSYPHSYNYVHDTSREEAGQEENAGNSYIESTVETVSLHSHNPSASFFPDLSVSPSPEPELLHTHQASHSSAVSSAFDSSAASSPALDAQDRPGEVEHNQFSGLGPPFLSAFLDTPDLPNSVSQQTSITTPKRKRGRPPKNSTAHSDSRRHRFCTFRNGFAMSFTAEDDYRVVAEDEFDGGTRQPIEDAITLDPKKRAEKSRAAPTTAAATRERRQAKPPAASTEQTSSKGPAKKGKTKPAKSAKTTPTASAGRRVSSRTRRATDKAAPKYTIDDSDSDDDDDDDHENDNFTSHSSSNSDDDDEDKDSDDEEVGDAHPERVSSAGHSLRARGKLAKPDRLREYVSVDSALHRGSGKKRSGIQKKGKHSGKYKRLGRGLSCQHCQSKRIRCDGKQPKCGNCVKYKINCVSRIWLNGKAEVEGDSGEAPKNKRDKTVTTQREDIRLAIQEGATKKRHNFFMAYEHLFLPLLPERNFITKLKETEEKEKLKGKEKDKGEAKGENKVGEGDIKMKEENEKNQTLGEALEHDVKDISAEEKHEAVPYQLLEKQPSGVLATMKPYQIAGLSFLVWLYNNGASGLLGDEMGLGKTLQTLSLFSYLTENHPSPPGHHRPFLVVCPLSVLSSWMNECKRWTPHLRAMRFHGPVTEKERMKKLAEIGEPVDDGETVHPYDIIVTTYEVFEKEVAWFRRAFVWRYVVLDEGHKIKNEQTQISQALQGLSAEYRLVLTGTPLQNNLKELWALLHFILPEVFPMNTQTKFMDAFNLTLGKVDKKVMDDSRKLLELIMLRRMKDSKGVNLGLPPKREVVLSLPLTPMQKFWYKRLLTRLDKGLLEDLFKGAKDKEEAALKAEQQALRSEEEQLEKVEEGLESESPEKLEDSWKEAKTIMEQSIQAKTTGWQKLMNLLMQLRKCCNHPYLLPGAAPEPYSSGMHLMLASSKFIILDRLIDELCIKQGRKVLIFSGFTKMLDVVEEFLLLKGGDGEKFNYSRLDGGTCRARRNLEIRLFNTDPKYKIMLLSTRAGGLGINLATASDVVMLESDWNPQADLQAQARAHRIGQTNEVTVYRLVTQGTVEEQMMGRIRKKLYLSAKVTESMRDIHSNNSTTSSDKKGPRGRLRANEEEDSMPNLTTGQLMSLVRRGAQAITKPEIDPEDMLKWNWDEMVDRTKDYEMTLEPNDQQGKKKTTEGQDEEKKDVEILAAGVTVIAEEDLETKWLSEMEKVETRLFEGREHKKREEEEHAKLVLDITRGARRDGKNRVVMINGHAVLKETVGCGAWEAVPTISGKGQTIFSEPTKKKRDTFEHQDYCQICYDGGTITLCHGCPRAYHVNCLPTSCKYKAQDTILGGFYCPQHQCAECDQKTTNAGGMLFRCRWCENAFCEDCMDWEGTTLIGDSLVEMDLLQYGEKSTVYWIKCVGCIGGHAEHEGNRKMCDEMAAEWDAMMAEKKKQEKEEARLRELRELEADKSASGAETPGVGASLVGTQVTTTAATSVGSDEDEEDNKRVIIDLLSEDGAASATDSMANSHASSRVSKRIAVAPKVSYALKKQKSGPQGKKKAPEVEDGTSSEPAVRSALPTAGVKRKKDMDGTEAGGMVKRRR